MKLDLRAVEALDAVVRHGGFGRAATHLHRVQSAVSHQIAKLESHLGLRLLDREDYRVRLTPAGEAVLAEGRRLLAQAERIRSVAHHLTQGWEPRLLIVIDGILPLDPALAAVQKLTGEQVPTRIQVSVEFLRGVQARFDRDHANLMLVVDHVSDSALHEEALPEMDCVLCVGSSHPLARDRCISLSELHEHVELSVQHSDEEQEGDRHLLGCERRVYLPSFHSKREALLMGVGFGWMPLHLAWDGLRAGRLHELRYVGGGRYRVTPRIVYRAGPRLGPAATRFLTLLREGAWPKMTWPRSRGRTIP
jgi:DNA-binding transcriptional LysR family regulator